ncbi:MAG: cupin domain-containing protein [Rhodospirillales bacterium]|nr:MAG: cupin domain-containing protein [Rhodospirillales bacterium]
MINHHPPLELLFDYAAGTLPEPVALAVATHASMCPACRDEISAVEALGGALLETLEPVAMSATSLDAVLARLDEPEATPVTVSAARAASGVASFLPGPLRRYLGEVLPGGWDRLPWRRVTRSLEELRLPMSVQGFKASLMRLAPGSTVPVHTHRGQEFTLVLAGGFSDETGEYLPGDFACKDQTHVHRPVVDTDEPCISLVVLDAPLKLTGMMGRLVNPFINRM